jgi:hypothetical protein
MTKEPTRTVLLKREGKLVALFGEYVAVVWPARKETTVETMDGGWTRTIETWVIAFRSGDPYITFYDIREGSDGEPYIDEDSPVAGGMHWVFAREIAGHLSDATDYVEAIGNGEVTP